jgi:anti-sigma regulatory factor (Ser/Thr protein kinase)
VATVVPPSETSWLLRYARSFAGRLDQVREVRGFLLEVLVDLPRASDAVAVGSELSANACLHSRSGLPGGAFTVRVEVSEGDYLYVAVQDDGGLWPLRAREVKPEHGLDLVPALAGHVNWGIGGGHDRRVVWAKLYWPGAVHLADCPAPAEAPPNWTGDDKAELGRQVAELAEALATRCLAADVATQSNGLPYLDVHALQTPAVTGRIYPHAGWYLWPTAERIAATDDVQTAADVIARRLQDWDGPAGA